MSDTEYAPTDDQIDAACRAAWEARMGRPWDPERSRYSDEAREDARVMLTAVGPSIAGGALRDAADGLMRSDDTGWPSSFKGWLRDRADQIEQGRQ